MLIIKITFPNHLQSNDLIFFSWLHESHDCINDCLYFWNFLLVLLVSLVFNVHLMCAMYRLHWNVPEKDWEQNRWLCHIF